MNQRELKLFLDRKVKQFNQVSFIPNDPISIPHRFSKNTDIEIAGLFAAIFSWGQRKTIINKCTDLMNRMDHSPYQFISGHSEHELKYLLGFKHRTFNDTDLLYVIDFLKNWYQTNTSLESAFQSGMKDADQTVEHGLNHFRKAFTSFTLPPERTLKHFPSPSKHSACKRLNMYLRWMVRKDRTGVDFGIWNSIKMSQLVCPLDVHVQRTALDLGLIQRTQPDWQAAIELTSALRQFDPKDPVRYDYALFGIGVSHE
jgi:uncharacterized protein (TIGR02757 family)